MKQTDFNNSTTKPRVLVAPLEWGLGHATRCIPIIQELIANDCVVFIAAEKATQSLLQHEFPQLQFLSPPCYKITYSSTKWLLPFAILFQSPKILKAIYLEHQWLATAVEKHKIDAVVSDNRFGLYLKKAKCVYITHQLRIKTGNGFTEKLAQKIHYWFIKQYNICWVPDYQYIPNLAGDLSHPSKVPKNVQYIGCLSRLNKMEKTEKKYDLLAIISGPEPQRSIFEQILLKELKKYEGKALLILGKPGDTSANGTTNNITVVNHLTAKELNEAINQSTCIISRSGYTTVMDMVKLKQKAILVPTPGQTEQEYLANHLMKQNMFYCIEQDKFSLPEVLEKARTFNYNLPDVDTELYKASIREFVRSI